MAISFVGAGAGVAANNATVTPALPSGIQAGDLLLCLAYTRSSTGSLSGPSGWSTLTSGNNATGGKFALYYKKAAGGDANPSVAVTLGSNGDTIIAQCAAFRGADADAPSDVIGTLYQSGSNVQNIGPISGITPGVADTLILVVGGKTDDWTSVATLSGDSLTWAEIGEPSSTLGSDAGMVWDYAIESGTVAVTSKTFTVTGGVAALPVGRMLSIKPASSSTPKAGTDASGATTEDAALAASIPASDVDGTHVETATLEAQLAAADTSAAGTDAATVAAAIAGTDASATVSEAASVEQREDKAGADGAAAAEAASLAASIVAGDAGAGAEAAQLQAAVAATDASAAGQDAGRLAVAQAGADVSQAATDAASVAAALQAAETPPPASDVGTVAAAVAGDDAAGGLDAASVTTDGAASLAGTDVGTGVDSATVTVSAPAEEEPRVYRRLRPPVSYVPELELHAASDAGGAEEGASVLKVDVDELEELLLLALV